MTEHKRDLAFERVRTLEQVAAFCEGRKIADDGLLIAKDAAMGFNLACDFIAHELRKLALQKRLAIP